MSLIRFLQLYVPEVISGGTITNGISFYYYDGTTEIPADDVFFWDGAAETLAVEFEQVP